MQLSTPEKPIRTPLKILLMGPPGSRKTSLALQFPNVLIEDCDRNLAGPERWLRANGHKDLKYAFNSVRYDSKGQMREIHDCYNALCDDLTLIANDPQQFNEIKTLVVDSLSHVNEFIIRHTLALQGKQRKTLEMEPRDWSPFKSYAYVLLVSKLEQTNKNVICTAHEIKLVEPDAQNIMKERVLGVEPFFQGKVGDTIGAFFTDVWRMELRSEPGGKMATILQTTRTPKCEHLKNSLNMPAEIDVTTGYKAIEKYLNL